MSSLYDEVNELNDAKEAKEVKDAKDIKDTKVVEDTKVVKDTKVIKDTKVVKEIKEAKEAKETNLNEELSSIENDIISDFETPEEYLLYLARIGDADRLKKLFDLLEKEKTNININAKGRKFDD